MIRVITSTGGPAGLEAVVAHLNRGQGPTDDATRLTELLGSMPTGAAAAPPGWQEVSRKFAKALDPKVRELSLRMDALFANTTAIDALRTMSDRGYRHLPVVADGKILGVISRGDFKGLELDRLEDETHLWECIG